MLSFIGRKTSSSSLKSSSYLLKQGKTVPLHFHNNVVFQRNFTSSLTTQNIGTFSSKQCFNFSRRSSLLTSAAALKLGTQSKRNISVNTIPRGEERKKIELKVGDTVHNYRVTEVTPVPERNLITYKFDHLKTGAKHLHIDTVDTNNAFCVSFKTVPKDSTGIAHILEHTTLCGSEKFPVRDPFFNMLKRSLNTYMNAWTGPDFTSYPFTTQNPVDFSNLLSVYLDSVFFPKLKKIDFMQEGHRLEYEKKGDEKVLKIKGVVFNEMKGSMSDPSNIFSQKVSEAIFPDTIYSHNSGGDPMTIPSLTHEQLVNFHKTHYHPSNSLFLTYGDLSVLDHLQKIDEILSKFTKINPDVDVPLQSPFSQPKTFEVYGPPSPMTVEPEKDSKFTIAYLMNTISDPFESNSLSFLSSLLLSGPNAPFYQNLIDANIGQSYCPNTGYDPHAKQAIFGVGLQGITKDAIPKVQSIIEETFKTSAEKGFDEVRINSLIHQTELSAKHLTSNFGIQLIGGLTTPWIHGSDPVKRLFVSEFIEKLREKLKAGPYFQDLIKKYFLNNPHKIELAMHPDPEYTSKLHQEEENLVKKFEKQLTEKDKQDIEKLGVDLEKYQSTPQDISCLPSLKVADIPKLGIEVKVEDKKILKVPVTLSPQQTNGIVYFHSLFNLPDLPTELIPYVPFFCSILTAMGTSKMDHRQLAQEIELYTGGIGVSPNLISDPSDFTKLSGKIKLSGTAFSHNIDHLFRLLDLVLKDVNFFKPDLLRTYISDRMVDFQDSLMNSGNSFAASYAASSFRRGTKLSETWDGISQMFFVNDLSQLELDQVSQNLKRLAKIILENNALSCFVTCERSHIPQVEKSLTTFFSGLPQTVQNSNIGDKFEDETKIKTYFAIPGQVNYVAKCISTIPYNHPDSPSLNLAAQILSNCYLHRELREKGGAYGGSANSSTIFTFTSYRDPNVQKTLDTFSSSLKWLQNGEFTEQDIEEAKLSIFSRLDSPRSPSSKGVSEWMTGITYEMKQKFRERLFQVSKKDVQAVTEKYLLPKDKDSPIAVVGSDQNAEFRDNQEWEYISCV